MQSAVAARPVLPALQTGGGHHQQRHMRQNSDLESPAERPATGPASVVPPKKRNSIFSKTFRTFSSSSSFDTLEEASPRSRTPPRRVLQKTPTNGSSIFHRLSRRTSKDSTASSHTSDASSKLGSVKVLKHGPLRTDAKLWKSRSEYLVLTETCLVRFNSVEAAMATFAEVGGSSNRLSRTSTSSSIGQDAGSNEPRLEIPLGRIINIFNEEGSSPHFGLDVWWAEAPPMVSWANLKIFFGLPYERDEWMAELRRAFREFAGKPGVPEGVVAPNVEARIHDMVSSEEPSCRDSPLDIFPVIQRTSLPRNKVDGAEASKKARDASSYYLLLGQNKCYLVRLQKTSIYKKPQDLEMSTLVFGLTSLIRLKATMVPHEERFVLAFRTPCESEKRLELASRWYREIVTTFMKADRVVKPAWPQHLQKDIFDIRGLKSQLHLPCGQDFGGLGRTLEAYCASYGCKVPDWTVNWKCERREHSPEFRLLPSREASGYTAFQLLAVFKALRYNDYFRSLSFRDVDFAPLCGWHDLPQYGDAVADVSRNGMVIDNVHDGILRTASILFQEIHAITFTSGSIKKIDLTNVLGSQRKLSTSARFQSLLPAVPQEQTEVARPILLLLRTQNISLDSLLIGGNPLTQAEIDELVAALCVPNVFQHLDISHCNLDERCLQEIWDVLPEQGSKLEVLNTSRNFGTVDNIVIRNSLAHFTNLRKLEVAGNCLTQYEDFMFYDEVIMTWQLEELDLSDIKLSEETVNVLATYLAMPESDYMRRLDLNNCGLTGTMAAVLFRSMGQGRELVCSISGNYLENGGDDLASAVGYNYGPTCLFLDMVEYRKEENFIKLIRAFAVSSTIRLLSLMGTATPGQVSEEACAAVSDFFATNQSVQYLDFSGFSAKLDEGQLGLGFSRSLAGLAQNRTLHHLRIRNQKLNINIGDLASAIAMNETLRTLDVQENGFNLSNLTHMARSLEGNKVLCEFRPFSDAELNRTIKSSVQQVALPPAPPAPRRRLSSKAAVKAANALTDDASKALVQELKGEWTVKMTQIEKILERNRAIASSAAQLSSCLTPAEYTSEYFAEDLPALFGGLATIRRGAGQAKEAGVAAAAADRSAPVELLSTGWDDAGTRSPADTAPHHVSREEVMHSPTEGSPGASSQDSSGLPTPPPEWAAGMSPADEVPLSPHGLGPVMEREVLDVPSTKLPLNAR